MGTQEVVGYGAAKGETTRTLIRGFTDEVVHNDPEDSLAQSLRLAVEEKDRALELARPWRSQYEAPITVYDGGRENRALKQDPCLIRGQEPRDCRP